MVNGGLDAALRASDPGNTRVVPIDLVTASASGLERTHGVLGEPRVNVLQLNLALEGLSTVEQP